MRVEVTDAYQAFNDMVLFYRGIGNRPEMDIISHPSEVEETNVLFVTHDYTFGIWVTSSGLTIHELGFQIIPKQVFELNKVETIDYDLDHIEVFFKKGYKSKAIFINLNDITKSSVK